jgi:GNAT superfamily N-acetyltransferase
VTLHIRPTQPADRDAVFAFCAHIWGGHDYVPGVWDEWLDDAHGLFLTALLDNVPVAVARAYFPAPDEAWLEGMRVDPAHRGAGIALEVTAALVEACRARGARAVRLMTVEDNTPIHHICARLGLDLIMRLRRRMRPWEEGPAPAALRQLRVDEAPLARSLLNRGKLAVGTEPLLTFTHGLYSLGGGIWTVWNEDRLRAHLAQGEVWTWMGTTGPRAVAVVCPHRRRAGLMEVGLLEGPGPDCTALLSALVRRDMLPAGDPDHPPGVRMYLPIQVSRLHRAASRAGYRVVWRGQMFIYEKELGV